MLLVCEHCRTQVEGKLDPNSEEVICLECGQSIESVSEFMKASMKRNRDFLTETRRAFSFYNKDCPEKKPACPSRLSDDGKTVICEKCGKNFEVTTYMRSVIKDLYEQDSRAQSSIVRADSDQTEGVESSS